MNKRHLFIDIFTVFIGVFAIIIYDLYRNIQEETIAIAVPYMSFEYRPIKKTSIRDWAVKLEGQEKWLADTTLKLQRKGYSPFFQTATNIVVLETTYGYYIAKPTSIIYFRKRI